MVAVGTMEAEEAIEPVVVVGLVLLKRPSPGKTKNFSILGAVTSFYGTPDPTRTMQFSTSTVQSLLLITTQFPQVFQRCGWSCTEHGVTASWLRVAAWEG